MATTVFPTTAPAVRPARASAPASAEITERFKYTFRPNFSQPSEQRAQEAPGHMAGKAREVAAATGTRLSDVAGGPGRLHVNRFSGAFTGPAADARNAVDLMQAYGDKLDAWVGEPERPLPT